MKEVIVIFPALDEEETIAKVIDEVPVADLEKKGYRVQIVVVDNGSSDRTGEIAGSKGARVIVEPRRGKGRAIRTAFESVKGDFVFMLDADFT
jgi:glycosyltransferase involved in cell wall biosynthesis